jgi:hypothetical protein
MTASDTINSEIDAAIEAQLDQTLGPSFFATSKQTCALLKISMATFNRAAHDKRIETTPRGNYRGVSRPILRRLLKHGLKKK